MASQIPKEHIRHCMLFEFRKGNSATAATKNICDVYPSALDVRKCQRWFSRFRSGNFDLSDAHRSGRPTTLDNDVLRAEVEANPCQTIEELSNSLNQPWSTIQEHLPQIGKISRAGVLVPHNLSEQNKANRSITCNVLLQRHRTDPFFDRLITGDEKWVLYDNLKRKRQWLSRNELQRTNATPGLHPKKALLCVWWNTRGVVYFKVLEPGQTVNVDVYCEQLEKVNQSLIKKNPKIVNGKGVILQHDNTRSHCAKRTLDKINELGWEVLPHPPYSPDITPSCALFKVAGVGASFEVSKLCKLQIKRTSPTSFKEYPSINGLSEMIFIMILQQTEADRNPFASSDPKDLFNQYPCTAKPSFEPHLNQLPCGYDRMSHSETWLDLQSKAHQQVSIQFTEY
ncbi:histone-lysine N-methyltransferase SETMAR-like [Battus philenor]|uniref:histone-lysine N-methyltransferase SETMAR-like n=1 Tax=Battus philenor TaxID=42288 RepID=UPI0035CF5385